MNTKSAQFLHEVLNLLGYMPILLVTKDGYTLYTFSITVASFPESHELTHVGGANPEHHADIDPLLRRMYEQVLGYHLEKKTIGYANGYHGNPAGMLELMREWWPRWDAWGKIVQPKDL